MNLFRVLIYIVLTIALLTGCATQIRETPSIEITEDVTTTEMAEAAAEQTETVCTMEADALCAEETAASEATETERATDAARHSAPETEPKQTASTTAPTTAAPTEETTEPTEAVQPTETTVANTPTDTPTDTPTETEPETPIEQQQTYGGFSDADINRMATVVSGEIGGIVGTITVTYADGTRVSAGQDVLRMTHAMVLVNQVHSSMFPNSLSSCIRTYWSSSYDNPYWQSSSRWQSCRQAVVSALNGGIYVPSNVYAATCDPSFGSRYSGYHLYARVDWNTGYVRGTFYYYAYG